MILILACAVYVGFSCTDDFINRTVIHAITCGNRRFHILLVICVKFLKQFPKCNYSHWVKSVGRFVQYEKERRKIGFMIEAPALYPGLSVLENLYIRQLQYCGKKDTDYANQTLELVGTSLLLTLYHFLIILLQTICGFENV